MITIDHAKLPRQPSPIEQIRAMEQTQIVQDAMKRAGRLAALVVARTELVRQQAARTPPVIVTHDQAHAHLLAKDGHYKVLWDLEQAVEPLRKLVL